MMRVCTICARAGSKGVKNKNIRMLAGKPLILHSIEQALASGLFAAVAVSSDSAELLEIAARGGATHCIERPAELAQDSSPKIPAIRHCALSVEATEGTRFETIVDLDATAPLRDIADIRGAVETLEQGTFDNLVSAMPARRSPYFNLVELTATGRVELSKPQGAGIARRQDSPKCFDLNASVFCWTRDALINKGDYAIGTNTGLFVMPEERSFDIDTEFEFGLVEHIMSTKERQS